MVIGVVPRYDPHGMGLPPATRPVSGSFSGSGGAGVPAWGRQRAATASSLDQPSEVGPVFVLLFALCGCLVKPVVVISPLRHVAKVNGAGRVGS